MDLLPSAGVLVELFENPRFFSRERILIDLDEEKRIVARADIFFDWNSSILY